MEHSAKQLAWTLKKKWQCLERKQKSRELSRIKATKETGLLNAWIEIQLAVTNIEGNVTMHSILNGIILSVSNVLSVIMTTGI